MITFLQQYTVVSLYLCAHWSLAEFSVITNAQTTV